MSGSASPGRVQCLPDGKSRPLTGDDGFKSRRIAAQALGHDIDAAGLGVGGANPVLQPCHRVLDIPGAEVVAEIEAQRDEDFIRSEMHGAAVVQAVDPRLRTRQGSDALARGGLGGLARQQALALEGENPAVTARMTPISTEATPSSTGRAKASVATTPIRATTRPASAALSSNRTVKTVGPSTSE